MFYFGFFFYLLVYLALFLFKKPIPLINIEDYAVDIYYFFKFWYNVFFYSIYLFYYVTESPRFLFICFSVCCIVFFSYIFFFIFGKYNLNSDIFFFIYTIIIFFFLLSFASVVNPDFWVVPKFISTPLEVLMADCLQKKIHYFKLKREWEAQMHYTLDIHDHFLYYYNGGVIGSKFVYSLSFYATIYRILTYFFTFLPKFPVFFHEQYYHYMLYYVSNTIFNFWNFYRFNVYFTEIKILVVLKQDIAFVAFEDLKINEDILQAKFSYLVEGGSGVFFLERHSLASINYDSEWIMTPDAYF